MNKLFYGDNLYVLRDHLADDSVDLIYLDPPFNSKRDYNLLFKSPKGQSSEAQIEAFEDTWHWNEQAEREYDEEPQPGAKPYFLALPPGRKEKTCNYSKTSSPCIHETQHCALPFHPRRLPARTRSHFDHPVQRQGKGGHFSSRARSSLYGSRDSEI